MTGSGAGRGTSISAGRGFASRRAARFSPQATGGGTPPQACPARCPAGPGEARGACEGAAGEWGCWKPAVAGARLRASDTTR